MSAAHLHHIDGPAFAWSGSKWKLAPLVWSLLGRPALYIEPFGGTCSVLLRRPEVSGVEVAGDLDGLVSNFFRAVQRDPEAVADWADYPPSEAEMHAWHLWLVKKRDQLTERLIQDPDWYDPQAAGRWAWGASIWYGGAWCAASTPRAVPRRKPNAAHSGRGVARPYRPWRQRPECQLDRGVHLGDVDQRLAALSRRLRHVRLVCGPWERLVSDGLASDRNGGVVGIYLDPPYDPELRARGLYALDGSTELSGQVRARCIELGADPKRRLVLSGAAGEHRELEDHGWTYRLVPVSGRAQGEGLWASPACLTPEPHPAPIQHPTLPFLEV
jgi:hypothetical protein